jgi:hypothetical protein
MEANMLKKLGFSALILGASLALAQPQVASAADRDDYRYNNRFEDRRDYREAPRVEHERIDREREEHDRISRRYDGYYDRDGCWHSSYNYDRR